MLPGVRFAYMHECAVLSCLYLCLITSKFYIEIYVDKCCDSRRVSELAAGCKWIGENRWLCEVEIRFANQQNTMTPHVTRRVRFRRRGIKSRGIVPRQALSNFPRSLCCHPKVQALVSLKQCPLLFHPLSLPLRLRQPLSRKSLRPALSRPEEPSPVRQRGPLPRNPRR